MEWLALHQRRDRLRRTKSCRDRSLADSEEQTNNEQARKVVASCVARKEYRPTNNIEGNIFSDGQPLKEEILRGDVGGSK